MEHFGIRFSRGVSWIFENVVINKHTTRTYLCLIPKKKKVTKVGEFLLISLVSSLYKIIPKVLVERLKEFLPFIINDCEATFVQERQILDAILVTWETVEEWKNRKKGFWLKLDLEKSFEVVTNHHELWLTHFKEKSDWKTKN